MSATVDQYLVAGVTGKIYKCVLALKDKKETLRLVTKQKMIDFRGEKLVVESISSFTFFYVKSIEFVFLILH